MSFAGLDEFWPFYVSQHLKPWTRRLHFAGTTLGLAALAAACGRRDPWLLPCALFVSYGSAWIGHFFIERNAPATFQYPVLSFRADFRMYRLMWLGRMESEIGRLQSQIRRYRPA